MQDGYKIGFALWQVMMTVVVVEVMMMVMMRVPITMSLLHSDTIIPE
jgi:hypothetical protein